MKKVSHIVSSLLKDDRAYTGWKEPAPMLPRPEQATQSSTTQPVTHVTRPSVTVRTPPARVPDIVQREQEGAELDSNCQHNWQWKGGIKSCWLCGGAAPVDRRDASTSWRGAVYGRKK